MGERLYSLDALRGVAAIAVFSGHAGAFIAPLQVRQSQLSVDLFFMLSGFVLTRSYGAKLESGMTPSRFMLVRYIRIYPLYLIGFLISVMSGITALAFSKGTFGATDLAIASLAGLVLLPSPTWRANPDIMPLNPPGWSLFFELLANLALGMTYRKLDRRSCAAIVALSFVGMLASIAFYGDFIGGFYWRNIAAGIPRTAFSFFAGVLLFKSIPDRRYVTNLAWLLCAAFLLPLLIVIRHAVWYDLVYVTVACPLLVGVGAMVQPPQTRVAAFLGDLSYPLYVMHVPVLFFLWRALHAVRLSPEQFAPIGGVIVLLIIAAGCVALDHRYDRPVRRWIMRRYA